MNELEKDIDDAYRWILGRAADPTGLEFYAGQIGSGRFDLGWLRRVLLESEEFSGPKVPYAVVDMANGLKIVVDPAEPEFGRHIAATGIWEPHIVTAITAGLRAGDCFVDIGANVGVMSFHAAQAVGPSGRVIGFEPNPRNVAAMRRGIVANGFDQILLFPFALADQQQMIGVTTASNGKVTGEALATQADDVIQAVRADDLLAHEPRIDFVKIDIEGYEPFALRGMCKTLARHKPTILCEFNPLCLRAQDSNLPSEFADEIFLLSPVVHVIEHDGSTTELRSASELLLLWHERDENATKDGTLPAGWVHFDLMFKVG